MGFQNTSQRYEYIFGSSVRKLNTETAGAQAPDYLPPTKPGRKAQPVRKQPDKKGKKGRPVNREERERAIERNCASLLTFDWKYTVIIVVSLFFVLMGALLYVRETAVITAKERQVYSLKEEKVKLLGRQSALQSEIDKATNLREIEEYAKKHLGMVYPTREKTLYYTGGSDDYFRQYEIVDSK